MDKFPKSSSQIVQAVIILAILFLSLSACGGVERSTGPQSEDNQAMIVTEDPSASVPAPGKDIVPGEFLRFDRYSVEEGLSQSTVFSILQDSQGYIWLGTIHGLDRFEQGTETFTHFNVKNDDSNNSSRIGVATIYESREGQFWVGTTDGLYQFDRQQERWSYKYDFGLGDDQQLYLYIILEDKSGILWIGTLGEGLYIFNPKSGEYSQVQNLTGDPQSLSQNYITALLMDQAGSVWVGTNTSGLDRFDPRTNTFERYREKDGLPNDSIYCTLEDGRGNIWISTNHGLSRLDPITGIFTNYKEQEVSHHLRAGDPFPAQCHPGAIPCPARLSGRPGSRLSYNQKTSQRNQI